MASFDRPILRRTFQALCLSLFCAVATPAVADNLPDVQRLMKQNQYPQALEKVDAYLATRPKDAQGRFLKGLILTEMDRPANAIEIFTKLTEDYPELPEPYNNLAVLYAQQKQYDQARRSLEMAIRTHPSYAIAYENLGDVYAKLASQAYDKALQLDSANAGAQNKLALIRDLVTTPGKPTQVRPTSTASVAAATPTTKVVSTTPTSNTPPAAQPVVTKQPPAVVPSTPAATTAAPVAAPEVKQPKPEPLSPAAAEVTKALAGWATAWSEKDVKGYLAYYGPGFTPPKEMSRKAWEAERTERINRPSWIKVTYDDPKVTVDGDYATVRFRQNYNASNLKNSTNKTLVFKKSGGNWLIISEASR